MKECSKLHPAPPCEPGYYVKNGCCYKIKKNTATTKKNTTTSKSNVNKSTTIENTSHLYHFKHTEPKHVVVPKEWVHTNNTNFVNWLSSTFIGYKQQTEEKEVSCDIDKTQLDLFPHQRFVRDYLQYKSPYRGLLLYHGLGVGKTCSSIAVAEMLLNYKKVIVMLPASLKTNYIGEIRKCGNSYYNKNDYHWVFIPNFQVKYVEKKVISKNNGVWLIDENKPPNFDKLSLEHRGQIELQINSIINSNYEIINYNGLKTSKVRDMFKDENIFDDKVVIIDEVHNFISGVSNNSKINASLYKKLMEAKNVKIILLSGTPIINKPQEIAFTINLLKGIEQVSLLEIDETNEQKIHSVLSMIDNISEYSIQLQKNSSIISISFNPANFEKKASKLIYTDVYLSPEDIIKKIVRTLESKKIKIIKERIEEHNVLPVKSDEFSKIFIDEENGEMINPNMFMRRILGSVSYFVNNDSRLFPSVSYVDEQVNISDYQYDEYLLARKAERNFEKKSKKSSLFDNDVSVYKSYSRAICNYVFPKDIKRRKKQTFEDPSNIEENDDIALKALNSLSSKNVSSELKMYSPKFHKMIENIKETKGNVLVYSNFSTVEGVGILSKCLDEIGYSELVLEYKNNQWTCNIDKDDIYALRYIRFKNDTFVDDKKIEFTNILLNIYNNEFSNLPDNLKKIFNSDVSNLRGDILKVLFITQSGAEGISLKNVRQVHITEPFWNQNRIDQVIGRANRTCSHINLPVKDRNFIVYKYTMKFTEKQLKKNDLIIKRDKELTTDEVILKLAQKKSKIINTFLNCMQRASVDCTLNNNLNCFMFPVDIENKKAYSLDIKQDKTNSRNNNQKQTVNISKTLFKVHIKSKQLTYIYIKDTNELFDYNLYMSTNVLRRIGMLEKSKDKTGYVLKIFK
tara:strand:- start:7217 stop:9946 length:2730 start_codon:yes stop_codon:yes gene_type:complete